MQYMMEPSANGSYPDTNQLFLNHAVHTITVDGQGSLSVKPDQAILTIGILTESIKYCREMKV